MSEPDDWTEQLLLGIEPIEFDGPMDAVERATFTVPAELGPTVRGLAGRELMTYLVKSTSFNLEGGDHTIRLERRAKPVPLWALAVSLNGWVAAGCPKDWAEFVRSASPLVVDDHEG